VTRGTLLRVTSAGGSDWYFANTEKGAPGRRRPTGRQMTPGSREPLLLQAHRPNIFVLYGRTSGR